MTKPRPVVCFVVVLLVLLGGCKKKAIVEDTDQELFRSPDQLTRAREMNIGKWASDYFVNHSELPANLDLIRPSESPTGGNDDVTNDAWGRRFILVPADSGFVVRSAGQDGVAGNSDDINYRVARAGKVM